ncbi:unnamed protein product [Medioppia subpectinata]|uniref:Striatin-interacting protein 1 n=1 Tax=Medioppia subpectinata TaxID=1979941 RepID=A0A7R9PTU0_9ACAR|nr:unnamed protein product [Medioppia subpectinata]CAG2100909.1 unnamed protein product [Medioppia subpectinata]
MWDSGMCGVESEDMDFLYGDCDGLCDEMSELYSYTEEIEFVANKSTFEELMEDMGFPLKWTHMSSDQRTRAIERLSEGLEVCDRSRRMRWVRAVLYLIQGNFGECVALEDQPKYCRHNVFRLYDSGMFATFVQLLYMEIESTLASLKKPAVCLGDSLDMRIILSVLYTFVAVMNVSEDTDTDQQKELRIQFVEELSQPNGNELLAITLFQMITKFCNSTAATSASASHFPIKKVLLLLWKTLLLTLGGIDKLKATKNLYRMRCGLNPVLDDTLEVTRTMRAASPPASATDLIEAQQQRKMNRPFKRQTVIKQSSMVGDESVSYQDFDANNESNDEEMISDERVNSYNNGLNNEKNGTNGVAMDGERDERNSSENDEKIDLEARPGSPRPKTAPNTRYTDFNADEFNESRPPNESVVSGNEMNEMMTDLPQLNKGLPWVPKVRQTDIDTFLDHTRLKFVGYVLPNDRTTTAGLPEPILEGIAILERHIYVSLSEAQMKREEELNKYPLTVNELDELPLNSSAEVLYQAMLPSLPQYMIALLKILLAAAPTSKTKPDSPNIMSDVLPEEMPMTVLQSMKLGIDVNRHKEIIIKSVSAILLLLLKHYKLNHIYQFEYISQQLMFANCIPLVLKFFNQNISGYISAKNTISVIDFPACVIGEQPELTADTLEFGETQAYCWRNMFSCINLLRILNKLTKWKHSRIMMLVVFKSAPILKRALKVRHAMLQLYVLKLLKMQAKYLGRQWRKSNMKTMSAIYQKVRHRLNDDWAYGNDLDARPWDFQAEEFTLQANINRFHNRRYEKQCTTGVSQPQLLSNSSVASNQNASNSMSMDAMCLDITQPVDNNFLSILSRDIELTKEFKYNYETWLEREVFQFTVDWDQLLSATNTVSM